MNLSLSVLLKAQKVIVNTSRFAYELNSVPAMLHPVVYNFIYTIENSHTNSLFCQITNI
jgi:hypothetical protein